MGKLYFRNMDDEWEQFPTDEEIASIQRSALILEEMGYRIICQMCNEAPSIKEIKERAKHNEWTCPKCHTVNSAGKA